MINKIISIFIILLVTACDYDSTVSTVDLLIMNEVSSFAERMADYNPNQTPIIGINIIKQQDTLIAQYFATNLYDTRYYNLNYIFFTRNAFYFSNVPFMTPLDYQSADKLIKKHFPDRYVHWKYRKHAFPIQRNQSTTLLYFFHEKLVRKVID